ncbi:DNA-directed DNA polymerase [Tanacetum coccineum]
MASQDARLSKFEANFKQQQSEMTNKIDTFLKAINDRMTGALLSDTVKNPKLNVNPTSSVSSACSYPMEDPRSSSNLFNSVNAIKTCFKSTNTFKKTILAHAPNNTILDKYVESLELGKNGSAFIQSEMAKKMKDPGLFILPCRLGDSEPFDTLGDLWSCVNLIPLYLFKKLKIGLLEETKNVLGLADGTKSYPVGIVRNVEVYVEKLKLLEDFYVLNMQKDPTCPLLVARGFLANASDIIDCKKSKIAVGEGITRKMVEFLGSIPINFKEYMWESEDMIDKKIDWNTPQKEEDGACHIRIEMIDPDGEHFERVFQSIPTT